ncbi:cyclin-dependent kinase 4 inhibitor C [Salminus brasiliensis]|uniref:cyclin-dependent kinase 4 inhibitor C n=1 Tax=Salminus brasiliensis TaxID=930266 RepID=UPI003B831FBD
MAEASEANRLCTAAARGERGKVQLILQSNVDVNEKNKFGRTALQVVKMGCPRIVELLLQSKADPNVRDPVKGLTIAHDAAREGHADTLDVLVNFGADVNLQDSDGNLPLHLAAREGHLNVVCLLAPLTAQPFLRNREDFTPLDLALAHRRQDTAQWLQSYDPAQPPHSSD